MYIATYIIDIMALVCLIGLVHSSIVLNIERKKPFFIAIGLTIVIILSEIGTILANYENLNLRSLNILFNILGFTLAPTLPIAITLIFDRRILESYKSLWIPSLINAIASVLSPIMNLIFYVDAQNRYTRGEYFFIFILVYTINLLILAGITIEVGKKNNYPFMGKMLALSIFTIIGTSIQLIHPLAYTTWHCVTIALLLYYLVTTEFDSSFDTLTNFYNRTAFDKAIKHMNETRSFSLIILDIDDFKMVNDTYGHGYGDRVIKTVAEIIRKSFNKSYTCYRFGGDEFSILSNETDQEKIEGQIREMIDSIEKIREEGNPIPTVSYGYSIFRGGANLDFNDIIKDADEQMYHYKKAHKEDGGQGRRRSF
ncbi:MAG: GGDEF domain-containing protein [Tissierellaceae bacterium]